MKDKETKGWKKRLTSSYSYSMGESEYFMIDGKETNIDDLQDFISEIEQEAERRGYEEGWQDGFRAELENINKKDFVENKHEN